MKLKLLTNILIISIALFCMFYQTTGNSVHIVKKNKTQEDFNDVARKDDSMESMDQDIQIHNGNSKISLQKPPVVNRRKKFKKQKVNSAPRAQPKRRRRRRRKRPVQRQMYYGGGGG